MKAYLQSFFENFAYPERDTGELLAAYDAIVSDEHTATEWENMLATYDGDINCDFHALIARARALVPAVRVHAYTLELLLFICCTRKAREYYKERGIADAIWYDSMMDLRYKLDECREVWGICGSFVSPWFIGFFNLTRFALGRLQFELRQFEHTYEKGGKRLVPESRVINVHIPRTGAPLDAVSCEDAFRRAVAFFAKELEGQPVAFVCHSWLLYPENERILPARSNVRAFMKRFEILDIEEDPEHRDLWRLFDRPFTGDVDRLPYDSSLRRAYVDHLRAGGKTGGAYGVFFYA